MRDLRSRWNLIIVILGVISLAGCGALQATPRGPQGNNEGLQVSNPALNFGTVVVGSSTQNFEYVSNRTNHSITITQVTVSDANFRVSPSTTVTIPARGGARFMVSFAPQTSGSLSGTILISSNSASAPVAIPVRGTAIAAGKLVVSPASLSFGSVQLGKSQAKPGSFINTGATNVVISHITTSTSDFAIQGLSLPLTISPNQSVRFSVVFAPKAAGTRTGNLSAGATVSLSPTASTRRSFGRAQQQTASETATIALTGVGAQANNPAPGQLAVSSNPVSFGTVKVGTSQKVSVSLTNTGGSSVNLSQATVSGSGFSMSTMGTPMTIAPNQSTNVSITCAPKSAGNLQGNLSISSNASNASLAVPLVATAVAPGSLTANPGSLSFGSVNSGSTKTLPATLTNSGGSTVTISQAAFSGGSYTTSGLNLPITLAAGQSTSFNVVFAPQSAGANNFNLSITSDASNATLTVPVSGTGATAAALTASAASLSFGKVTVGDSQSLPETLTNSGGSTITVTQVAAGAGYSVTGLKVPATLTAGQSTSFSVVFSPQSAGNSNVNLAVTNDGPSPTFSIPLSGTGVTAGALTASSVSFGSVQVGNSSTKTATLTNSGGADVKITQANLTGSGFSMNGLSLPLTLSGGQSFTFNVVFAPQAAGAGTGSIAIVSDASGTAPSISLSGTGTASGQFSVNPGSFSFGSVAVGASKSMPATLSATGASVTVNSASVSSTEFSLTGPNLPVTIPAGGTASFTLTFTPQTSGTATATVSFSTTASGTPFSESVTGSATAAAVQHSVNLAWNPSSSSVTGYNVYRGTKTGGPYAKINSNTDTETTYTDSAVQAGQTYFYVTTAVSSDGMESSYSNQVSAAIPTP